MFKILAKTKLAMAGQSIPETWVIKIRTRQRKEQINFSISSGYVKKQRQKTFHKRVHKKRNDYY